MPIGKGNSLTLGTPLGDTRQTIRLTPDDRSRHLYVVGASGQGKSSFIEGLVRQDILAWPESESGLLLIDPDGTIFDGVMAWLASSDFYAKRPIIPIDFRRKDFVVSYNPLRSRPGIEASVVVNNFVAAVAHVWGDESVEKTPLFARYAKSVIQALYERGGTVSDAVFFLDQAERQLRDAMIEEIQDKDSQAALRYVHQLRADRFMDELGSTIRRLHPFSYNRYLRAMFGGAGPSLDLATALEEGQIVLMCLGQEGGNIDLTDAKLVATTMLADLWQTAGQRGKRDSVKPFYVYIDEFQEYLTPTIATTLARARGYGLHFTLAHQFPSQIKVGENGKRIFDSIVANADTVVAFQQKHPEDVELLANRIFGGTYNVMKEKLRIESTKVMDYEKVILRASSQSESSGSSTTTTSGSTSFDEEDDLAGRVESDGSTETGGSTTRGFSEHEAYRPILGTELSSVQYLSVEEQRMLAIIALQTQGKRHAVARIGVQEPTAFKTNQVESDDGPWVDGYVAELLQETPQALLLDEALALLIERHELIHRQLMAGELDEAMPARRRVKKP